MLETCSAIVNEVLPIGLDEEDRLRTWMADAEEAELNSNIHTARAIYKYAIKNYPTEKEFWK